MIYLIIGFKRIKGSRKFYGYKIIRSDRGVNFGADDLKIYMADIKHYKILET